MISFFVFLAVLSILIIAHEFGHFIAARKVGVRVEQFSLGFGPQLFRRKKGDTEYCISAIPLGGFVKMAGDSLEECKGSPDEYFAKAPGKRFWIIFLGPLLNYLLGFVFLWMIFFAGYPALSTKVKEVLKGFGAEKAGIIPGDRILSVDAEQVSTFEELQAIIYEKKTGDKVALEILRNNERLKIQVPIREKGLDVEMGKKRRVGLLGIRPDYDEIVKKRFGLIKSFFLAAEKTADLTVLTYKGLWWLVTGKMSVRESVTGPLGIFYLTYRATSVGLTAVLHLVAILSLSLAIFNLLPLPILDGGHILLLGIEKIRRKTLGIKTERIINQVGFTMIVSLALFITYNDIVRLFGDRISRFLK